MATVSMVLRNYPVRCTPETAELIRSIAKKYDYVPNYSAVSLVKKSTNSIGMVVPDLENLFFTKMIKLLSALFRRDGYTLLLCDEDESMSLNKSHVDFLKSKNVDAMILALTTTDREDERRAIIDGINGLKMPHVILDAYDPKLECECVEVDHYLGAEMATEHLILNGHRKIGCITGKKSRHSTIERLRGFYGVMNRYGYEADESCVLEGDYTFDSGYTAAKELLKRDITAIFAFNDMMAYGVMKAATEMGKRLPDDISLVGFDDSMFSSMTYIPLSTVSQPSEEIAERIYRKIMCMLKGERGPARGWDKVKPVMMVRDSVKRIGERNDGSNADGDN